MKHKIGDTIKIIKDGSDKDGSGHGFMLGDLVKITEIDESDYQCKGKSATWWVLEHEVEKVKKVSKKIQSNPDQEWELPDSQATVEQVNKWKNLKPLYKETEKEQDFCSFLLAGVVLVLATLLVVNYRL